MATLATATYMWRLTASDSYLYGINILIIILALISAISALHGIIQTPFFRAYIAVLFSALPLALYSGIIIASIFFRSLILRRFIYAALVVASCLL